MGAAAWWEARLPAGQKFDFGDTETYWVLGHALAEGEPYQFGSENARVCRVPGYPFLLSLLFRVGGHDVPIVSARYLNALFGVLAVVGVFFLARGLFGDRTALVAALLAAVYPGAIGTSVFVLSEAPFCPVLLACLLASVASDMAQTNPSRIAWTLATGASAGVGVLLRPSWLLFLPAIALVGLAFRENRRRRFVQAAIGLLAMCLVLTPWWIRNAKVVGRFVPTTLTVGASLYDGLHEGADGGSDMSFIAPIESDEFHHPTMDPAIPFEVRIDRRLRNEAFDWARRHPGRVLELGWWKFSRMWSPWPRELAGKSWLVRLATGVSFVPLVALAIVGAWRFRGLGWRCLALWTPIAYFTALHMVFVSSIRYREPAMLPLMVLAAAAIVSRKEPGHF